LLVSCDISHEYTVNRLTAQSTRVAKNRNKAALQASVPIWRFNSLSGS
jgi:hypothetical protein